jgi:hypothetical protein
MSYSYVHTGYAVAYTPSASSAGPEPDQPTISGHNPRTLLYRVYDGRSASPLTHDGFTATSPQFLPALSGTQWRKNYHKLYYSRDFRTADATREAIIQHVLGGWPGYTHRGYTAQSDWISTTESLDWAIWEVARRLVVLRRKDVGIGAHPPEYTVR